ncbi:Uncharacterised protein [Enterobacter hormaechei]|nr:Uncharacterised protein [Enterobacter hormaechei]
MAAGLGFAEGQNDMQVFLAPVDIPRRKPEVIMNEVVQVLFGRKQQRQGIQQAGFTPGVFAYQDVVLFQLQRQAVNPAKPDNLHTFE